MFLKHLDDQILIHSPTCGEGREVITKVDPNPFGIAIFINIKPTQGHYHLSFDETYFVLDGEITLKTFDPKMRSTQIYPLKANELCVITPGIHHRIIASSVNNRLCVISFPPFHGDDEHPSDQI